MSSVARTLGKPGFAFEFGKDHAETVFPQGIGREQQTLVGAPKHEHAWVMALGGARDEGQVAEHEFIAFGESAIDAEPVAALAGGRETQARGIPAHGDLGVGRRNMGARLRIGLLEQGVAAAMIRMQVSVDDAMQGGVTERAAHEFEPERGMRDVTGIDDRVERTREHHGVRRQPPALEDLHAGGPDDRGRGAHGAIRRRSGAVHADG